VRAVIAQSFERIHRSNLVGMGVLPLKITGDMSEHQLSANSCVDIIVSSQQLTPLASITILIDSKPLQVQLQVFTELETQYLKHGTILHKVLRDNL
jgi:aconitate hydratase